MPAKIAAIVCDVPAHFFAYQRCSAQAHLDALDSLALKLHTVLADGTDACIPHHSSNASVKPKVLIGWNNECVQLKADSLFWHRLWVRGGRLNTEVVHDYVLHESIMTLRLKICCNHVLIYVIRVK